MNRENLNLEGDSGKWEDSSEVEHNYIFEYPSTHIFVIISGGSAVILFFAVLFVSIYGYGTEFAPWAIFIYSIIFILSVPVSAVVPHTGNPRLEIKRAYSGLKQKISPSHEELYPDIVFESIESKRIICDWEIARRTTESISTVRSRLSHMESKNEIKCRRFGPITVCWKGDKEQE